MRKQYLIKSFLLLILVFQLLACSKIAFDQKLVGTWVFDENASTSYLLRKNLIFDSDNKLKSVDSYDIQSNEISFAITLPGYIIIDPDRLKIKAKYTIQGEYLILEFKDGINVYNRINSDIITHENFSAGNETIESLQQIELFDETSGMNSIDFSIEAVTQNSSGPSNIPTDILISTVSPTPQLYYPLPDCSASYIRLGDSVYVNYATGKMTIRKEPSARIGDMAIRKLDTGEVLHIIDGPYCDMGWVFWKVRTVYSEIGWIPEGDGKEFWVLPLHTENVCSDAKPTRLWVGARAYVEPEPVDHNRMYPEPVINSEKLIYRMKPGSFMVVLRGPECGPNHEGVWWYVRSEDSGMEGWTRESDYQKSYYFIAPIIPNP